MLPRPASYEDLTALGEDVKAEIIDAHIVVSPSPLPEHSLGQGAIIRYIGGPFHPADDEDDGGPGGWWIFSEVDVRLDRHQVVRPDVAGWRRERMPEPWGVRPIEVAPDWICEIISPSNERHDHVVKRRLYARYGVKHYWLLDPAKRILEALRLDGKHWVEVGVYSDDDRVRIEPFDAIELRVSRLFPPRPPSATEE